MMRIGFGYDVHRWAEDRRLVIGGVDVPFDRGLEGHSDADILLHAVADALLGAVALGDLGTHFPDSDPMWKDADSKDLLREVVQLVSEKGYRVNNVDATVVLEAPRLRPFIDKMRSNLSECLQAETNSVSVKATRGEGIGFVGREEGAAAYAVCTVIRLNAAEK